MSKEHTVLEIQLLQVIPEKVMLIYRLYRYKT